MEVIVLAAGLGKRMKINQPKQFLSINGKPMLAYSLEIFDSLEVVSKIILVCQLDHIAEYEKIIKDYDIKNVEIVVGGDTRQESVWNALQYIATDKVLIHEAARPLISKEFVLQIINSLEEGFDSVVPVVPVNFTVAIGNSEMEGILDRSKLKNIQLPQVFESKKLKLAHERAIEDGFSATEDSMLVFKYGGKVKYVEGRESNLKVTTMLDVKMISNFLSLGNE